MGRAPSHFRQQDVARAIKAAKAGGLDIVRVEIDTKTGQIALVVKKDEVQETKPINPWDTASTDWALPKWALPKRKETKANPFDNAPVVDPTLGRRKPKPKSIL
jgi:hypothetical protein